MIHQLFPVNILIKDYDFGDDWNKEMDSIVHAAFTEHMASNELSYIKTGDNELPLFTEENLKIFPILNNLRQLFVDGFYELAQSFSNNEITKEYVEQQVHRNTGRLPFMKTGDFKHIHNHLKASAFAVFYLTGVDNDKDGGQLILRDPAFHSNFGFHSPTEYRVETKRNRLIVVPSYVWHEVTPYLGNETRTTVVMNLDL